MLFMASEILHIPSVARRFPDSATARLLADQLDHRLWVGCAPWDLIQPAFMFMVGVALPFSIASRVARGQSFGRMLVHTVWRAAILVALGIFLRSQGRPQTYFTFEDVLTQIGLGYVFLFLLAWTKPRVQWAAAAAILVGYWAAFALYPLPPAGFDTSTVGVPPDWPYQLSGFAAHWNKNTNLAHAFDVWFLNLFPRERPFAFNGGGYLTLNFVPSLATMIFGLIVGGVLRGPLSESETRPVPGESRPGGPRPGHADSRAWHQPDRQTHLDAVVDVFSTGWVVLFLAGYYYVVDVRQSRGWTLPFLVVGANSIAMYVLVHVAVDYMERAFVIHLGRAPFEIFGAVFAPVLLGAATLAVFWGILYWMYRNRVLVRI